MLIEQLIRHQESLRDAAQSRAARSIPATSMLSEMLARTGDLLVTIGQGLQRRYHRVEEGVALAEYTNERRWGRAR